jgi:alkylhydroperoxidase family enzyme
MARLPYLTRADLPDQDQDLLKRDIALNRLLAHSPGLARAFTGLAMHIRHASRLDARLRELAILQVGWLARSPYEWSHHVRISQDFGCTEADIRAIGVETEGGVSTLETLARLVLQATREMWQGPAMSAGSFDALRRHLDAEALVELTLIVATYCGLVRFLATMEIDVEPDYMPYLLAHPLPA